MSSLLSAVTFAAVAIGFCVLTAGATPGDDRSASLDRPKSVYELKVKTIDGEEVELSRYRGDVMLIVNVASR